MICRLYICVTNISYDMLVVHCTVIITYDILISDLYQIYFYRQVEPRLLQTRLEHCLLLLLYMYIPRFVIFYDIRLAWQVVPRLLQTRLEHCLLLLLYMYISRFVIFYDIRLALQFTCRLPVWPHSFLLDFIFIFICWTSILPVRTNKT